MSTFETLFGIKESRVKNTCVVMPLLKRDSLGQFGVRQFSKGRLYGSGNSDSFTLIHTGVGPSLLGDAVLYLAETRCKTIILFGSCGLVKQERDMTIGSLVIPESSYSLESFSDMLLKKKTNRRVYHPDKSLVRNFLMTNKKRMIKKTVCASIGSLKLEEDYIDIFEQKNIQIVDMECSALFAASKYIGKRAMALFYITDIVNKKPFYRNLNAEEGLRLSSSIKSATNSLCDFIKKNQNC